MTSCDSHHFTFRKSHSIPQTPAAGLNPIQVAVDIDLQQESGIEERTPRCSRINTFKAKCPPGRVCRPLGLDFLRLCNRPGTPAEASLASSFTFDESLHDRPRYNLDDQTVRQSLAFSHSLGRLLLSKTNLPSGPDSLSVPTYAGGQWT
jgi:hypothetical protein